VRTEGVEGAEITTHGCGQTGLPGADRGRIAVGADTCVLSVVVSCQLLCGEKLGNPFKNIRVLDAYDVRGVRADKMATDSSEPAPEDGEDTMKFDEGQAVADRLDELESGESEPVSDLLEEYDEQFDD